MANNSKKTNPTVETKKNENQTQKAPEKLIIGKKNVRILSMLRGNYGAFDPGELVTIDARLAENFVKAHAAEYVEE